MGRSATLPKLTPQEGKPVDTCARYLLNNAKYLKYHDYLKPGFPIATGVLRLFYPWVLYTSVAIKMSIGSFIYNKNINAITWLCTLVVFL